MNDLLRNQMLKRNYYALLLAVAKNVSARALNVGEEIYLDCNPTASFTQPIPTTGSFRSMSGSSITTTSGVPFEMSILKIATSGVMYSITVKEKD